MIYPIIPKPPSFEFYFEPDDILIIEKFQHVINKHTEREEKNKIHLSIKEIKNDSYHFDAVFTTYVRKLPTEKEFKKEEEFFSSFIIQNDGQYLVEEKYKFPNVQSIPTFPQIQDTKELPKKWQKPGKEVINLLEINLKIFVPFIVDYTYLGTEEIDYFGKKVLAHKIQFGYELKHKVVPGEGPIQFIKGNTKGILYFSPEMHIPLYDEQNLFYEFTLKNQKPIREIFFIKTWYKKIKKINKENLEENLKQIQNKENFTVRNQERGIAIDLDNILFDFDSYSLKEKSKKTLDSIIEILKKYPNQEIQISGHTDNIGDENYNQELSEKRAKTIAEYLIQNGIPENQISYKGYGDKKPLHPNDTPENRKKNRRVEILIITE
ncbi:MAG: OmpA family protein [Leptonema sp. (in: bacteria)]